MKFSQTFIHSIAKNAAAEIDYSGAQRGIAYDGLVREEGEWHYADSAKTADVLVSVSISEAGETFRIFRRGFGTLVTSDFNRAEINLAAALGIIH